MTPKVYEYKNKNHKKVSNEQAEMEAFKKYLEGKKYYPETIQQTISRVNKFIQWWKKPSFGGSLQGNEQGSGEVWNAEYKHLLDYVQHEQKRGISTGTLHRSINSISHYFEFLNKENAIKNNPARTLRLKGKVKTITQNPLQYDELEKLYQGYKELIKEPQIPNINTPQHLQQRSILAHERNGIIVGLLIYQALTSGELERLSVEDINLTDGTIYIAGNARSNSRTLKLNTGQVLPLYSYLHGGTREKLIALPVVGLKSPFPSGEGRGEASLLVGKMYGVAKQIVQQLRGINPQVKNAQHIRASVILYWLKLHNKRQVQYMAGHRYIDSTEKYAVQEMDSLTDALTKYHPFG